MAAFVSAEAVSSLAFEYWIGVRGYVTPRVYSVREPGVCVCVCVCVREREREREVYDVM